MNIVDRFARAQEYEKNHYNRNKSQKQMCLEYLQQFGSITPLEALSAFNSLRLSSLIFRLRNDGYQIDTKINDSGKPYAIYTLIGEKGENDD